MLSVVTADSFDLNLDEVPIPEGATLQSLPYGDTQRIEKDYPGIKPGESVSAYHDRTEQAGEASQAQDDEEAERRHQQELAAQTDAARARYRRLGYPDYGILWMTQHAAKPRWEFHVPTGSGAIDNEVWRTAVRSLGVPDQESFSQHGFSGKWYQRAMLRYKDLGGRIQSQQL